MSTKGARLFALPESAALGAKVSALLNLTPGGLEEHRFPDGEHRLRACDNVRNADVYVLQSLHADAELSVNDKLCRLLFLIGALKDASAHRVTAVLPYLCYARQDRRTRPRDPVTTRHVAQLLEAMGTDRVVALDIHDLAAFENAFRCGSDHLSARQLFVEHFADAFGGRKLCVVSPDLGGAKRAERFRADLSRRVGRQVRGAFLEKHRADDDVRGESTVVGDVDGRVAIILDDMVSTGGTLIRAARACRKAGARHIYAAVTHGLFVGEAESLLADPTLEGLVVTDSIPQERALSGQLGPKLRVIDIAPVLADAICRMHAGGSIAALLGEEN
ncbi:MAG: ribose-phosphate pyrophosphokinase [Thiohalocapsa sp.]|nr:ribose-phosphate pyrophosphokinase [Thiohalocapsa sp.]MCF7991631.1 ribose-phosphate pyrophosphokinase [Thiohalocapsa sp.]